jgi:membrane-associated phospholipid phosphatase
MDRFFQTYYTAADRITVLFLILLSIIELVFGLFRSAWALYAVVNGVIIALIVSSARHVHRRGDRSNPAVALFRDWYLVPLILIIYTQTSSINYPIHGRDYDTVLIAIDRWIFAADPTVWISRFAHPLVTEILQIAYASYYLFFIALFFELYKRSDLAQFHHGAFLVVYGFYLSYIGYLLLPAVGPRFYLHDFLATETELPGLLLTPYLREIVNSGGGIPAGISNPIDYVHRDAFPSGHTQLTMVAMYVAFTARTKIRWWLFTGGSLLIVATIYMRYHYVVDVMAGIAFFFFTIWSGKRISAIVKSDER